jgi:hypothetical protein
MEQWPPSNLLALPVRYADIALGHVVDVILDAALERVLGLEVRCGDNEHRFLPLAAARVEAEEIVVRSPLALLEAHELSFYAERGTHLRAPETAGRAADVGATGR